MPVKVPAAVKMVLVLDALQLRAPPRQHVQEIQRTKDALLTFLGIATEAEAIQHLFANRTL